MKLLNIITAVLFIVVGSMIFGAILQINPLVFAIPFACIATANKMGIIRLPEGILAVNFAAITTASFPVVDGREAMGGYGSVAYLALCTDITTYPRQPDIEAVTNVNELAKLEGAFVMSAQKYFYKVRVKPRTLKVTPEGQGEIGGRSFKLKGQFYIPGIDADSMGLARFLNNKFGVLVIPDQSGSFRTCYGTEDLPLEFAATGDSGQAAGDSKGMTFTFEADSFAPGWIYNGAIPLTGAATLPAVS